MLCQGEESLDNLPASELYESYVAIMDKNKGKEKLNDELLDQVSGGRRTEHEQKYGECLDCGYEGELIYQIGGYLACPSCYNKNLNVYSS